MSDIQIDDFYDVTIQTDSRHPNLPSDIQIGGQIWMSDIFKFGCHAPKLFYEVVKSKIKTNMRMLFYSAHRHGVVCPSTLMKADV